MLSKKTKYAIKALVALAENFGKGPMLISTLAEEELIPKKFLEVILLELRNQGILVARKARGGIIFKRSGRSNAEPGNPRYRWANSATALRKSELLRAL